MVHTSIPSWTCVIVSPVAGLRVSNVLPDADLTNSLLIKS